MKNKRSYQLLIPVIVLSLISAACAISIQPGNTPETTVMPTATVHTDISEPTATSFEPTVPDQGSIRGRLSYPGEFIPPLRVVAFRVENSAWTQQYIYVDTNLNAPGYQINGLEAGFYWIVAYTLPGSDGAPVGLAGGYSQFVLCGLSVDCSDHTLISVEVKSGQATDGADPADWYAPEGNFPPNPAP